MKIDHVPVSIHDLTNTSLSPAARLLLAYLTGLAHNGRSAIVSIKYKKMSDVLVGDSIAAVGELRTAGLVDIRQHVKGGVVLAITSLVGSEFVEVFNRRKRPDKASWSSIKAKVYKLSDKRCYYCRTPVDERTQTIDHKMPISRGGSNKFDNLVVSCHRCNSEKGAMTAAEYIGRGMGHTARALRLLRNRMATMDSKSPRPTS